MIIGPRRAVSLEIALICAIVLVGAGRGKVLTNSWRGLTPKISTVSDVASAIGEPDRTARDVSYGSLSGLKLATYDDLKASLFFENDKLILVTLVPTESSTFPSELGEWESALGKPNLVLPGIRGKDSRVYVYSGVGLTATTEGSRVRLVELFSPMSSENYRHTIYKAPPVFVK